MFNQAKQEILDAVRLLGTVTSMEIALNTGRTPENASMRLLCYHKQGLLNRRTLHGKVKGYSITQRGLERLTWLESEAE